MKQEDREKLLRIIRQEISPALGCTEPVAAALCAAGAASVLPETPEHIRLEASEYILKNAMNVGIPGTDAVGLEMACALGCTAADPKKGLLVLENLTDVQKNLAEALVNQGCITVSRAETHEKVYLRVVAECGGHRGEAVISGSHGHFSRLLKDGQMVTLEKFSREHEREAAASAESVTVAQIWTFIQEVEEEELSFLEEAVVLNKAVAEEGLTGSYGLQVGRSLLSGDWNELLGADLASRAAAITAAAADARMSGCEKPVMSVAGSGNQGLTATLPVIVIAEQGPQAFQEKRRRALALSILVTVHAKAFLGKLSVLCGCSIAAAIGVTAAVVYLYGGTLEQAELGIKTMTADISGMICDGAKPGCALKIATSVGAAMRAAAMACMNRGAGGHDGIVEQDVEATLRNLGDLGTLGMRGTNQVILGMLLKKQNEKERAV